MSSETRSEETTQTGEEGQERALELGVSSPKVDGGWMTIDHVADPILVLDMGARIVDANRAACELYDWSREDLIGESFEIFDGREYTDSVDEIWQKCLDDDEVCNAEVEQRTREGEALTVLLTLSKVVDADGTPVGVTASVKDMTEHKVFERGMRQAQKMEAIGTLTSGVAHDFNNLLMGMRACADLAARELEAEHPALEYVDRIRESVDRGEALTGQLLAFSRKGSGGTQVVEVDEVVASLEELLRPLLGREIDLEVELDSDGTRVRCDAGQLEQVLLNLIVNARDALEDGGRVEVRTDRREVDDERQMPVGEITPGGWAVIEVKDEGVGMAEDVLRQIFDPFYTTKRSGEGTGLGLSIVYGILTQWAAAMEVETEPGEGSVFSVYLKEAEEPNTATDGGFGLDRRRRGEAVRSVVAIVEDNDVARQATRELLEQEGYATYVAASAERARELLRACGGEIDAVLLDVGLPDESGVEFAEWCRGEYPEVGIVFVSGGPTLEALGGMVAESEQVEFVQKPAGLEELVEAIGRVQRGG